MNDDFNYIKIETDKSNFNKIIKDYSFYNVMDEVFDIASKQEIINNLNQSKALIIDQFHDINTSEIFFILSFSKTIIIIKKSLISSLKNLLSMPLTLPIYFLSNIKEFFNQQIEIKSIQFENNKNLNDEICSFKENINILKNKSDPHKDQIVSNILSCIIGYLIRESYAKASKAQSDSFIEIQNIEKFSIKELNETFYSKESFIELRGIGNGSVSSVMLYYQLENGQLVAIKRQNGTDNEKTKVLNREKIIICKSTILFFQNILALLKRMTI